MERPGEWNKALPTPLEFQIGPGGGGAGARQKMSSFLASPGFSHCLHVSSQPTFLPLSRLPTSACSSGCSSCSPSIWRQELPFLPPRTSPRPLLLTLVLPAPTAQHDHEGSRGLRGRMERAELGHSWRVSKSSPAHPDAHMQKCPTFLGRQLTSGWTILFLFLQMLKCW